MENLLMNVHMKKPSEPRVGLNEASVDDYFIVTDEDEILEG